jgi:hypothetical protein
MPPVRRLWPRHRPAIVAAVLVAAGVFAGIAIANGTRSPGYTSVGPFVHPSGRDATTCGSIWASGRVTNGYKVFPQRADGSYLVLEEVSARLTTLGGQSVGACNNGGSDNGNTVGKGVRVDQTAQAVWTIRNGTFDAGATCTTVNPACFIVQFTRSFFGPSATFELGSSIALYETRCNGSWFGAPFTVGNEAGDITGEKNAGCED